jgi:hypothetical protein
MLILGLTRVNVTRLINGEPIRITPETHGRGIPEGWTIVIVFGETEVSIAAEFERSGLIGPDTKITKDPRL